MRSKVAQFSISLKLTLSLFFLFFLFLIIRSSFSFTQQITSSSIFSQTHLSNSTNDHQDLKPKTTTTTTECPTLEPSIPVTTCTKTPPSLANALVHYATTNITPQQTQREISVSMSVLEKKSPCNFLVFGLGHDSLMWTALNHGGRTVFLEEDKAWIEQIKRRFPGLESYHVTYDTKVHQAEELLKLGDSEECKAVGDPRFSDCQLALKNFPSEVYDTEWDLIMVDAPTGYFDGAPGRMSAIYTAGIMARNRESGETDVFVHDVDRVVEDKFSKTFLCEGYLAQQEGRLRHFILPSHRDQSRLFDTAKHYPIAVSLRSNLARREELRNCCKQRREKRRMSKSKKKQLMASAPWRVDDDSDEDFKNAKLKVTSQPGATPTMHVPRKKSVRSKDQNPDDSLTEIDPELRYSFQRNFQFLQRVFSIDTVVKPLPPAMAYNVSRNLNFFTRIFTQFFDPEGIANAQKSLGIGQEEKARRVR